MHTVARGTGLWGDSRDVVGYAKSPARSRLPLKVTPPVDTDHRVPSEPEQQVTLRISISRPPETPYCAWTPKARGKQGCFICINASPLPGNRIYCSPPSGTARASLQHAWIIPKEMAISEMGVFLSKQPIRRPPKHWCSVCPERLPSLKDHPFLVSPPHSGDPSLHLTPAWSPFPWDVPSELEKGM